MSVSPPGSWKPDTAHNFGGRIDRCLSLIFVPNISNILIFRLKYSNISRAAMTNGALRGDHHGDE
jgi:hypothetical protein